MYLADLPIELSDNDDCPNEPKETCGHAGSRPGSSPAPIPIERDGEISHEWEVEALLLYKQVDRVGWFEVKFKGKEKPEFLAEEDLFPGSEKLIKEFFAKSSLSGPKKRRGESSVGGRKRGKRY